MEGIAMANMKNTIRIFHSVVEIFIPQRGIHMETGLAGEEGGQHQRLTTSSELFSFPRVVLF